MQAPTKIEEQHGKDALARTVEACEAGKLLVVHYKCDPLDWEECKIHGIAVKNIANSNFYYFDALANEAAALRDFQAFASTRSEHVWLGWSMEGGYGVSHFQSRAADLNIPEIPALDLVDVNTLRWQMYGDTAHPRMKVIAEANGISTRDMSFSREGQNSRKTQLDARRWTEAIPAIWRLMRNQTLIVPNPAEASVAPKTSRPRRRKPGKWWDQALVIMIEQSRENANTGKCSIGTNQAALARELTERGFAVNQSTISRYLKNQEDSQFARAWHALRGAIYGNRPQLQMSRKIARRNDLTEDSGEYYRD